MQNRLFKIRPVMNNLGHFKTHILVNFHFFRKNLKKFNVQNINKMKK